MAACILLVEDHRDFRANVRKLLESRYPQVRILETASAEDAMVLAKRESPHIVLLDIRLPGMNGVDAASRIRALLPECAIFVLTMFEADSFRSVLTSDAIDEYIGKSELVERLLPAVERAVDAVGS